MRKYYQTEDDDRLFISGYHDIDDNVDDTRIEVIYENDFVVGQEGETDTLGFDSVLDAKAYFKRNYGWDDLRFIVEDDFED